MTSPKTTFGHNAENSAAEQRGGAVVGPPLSKSVCGRSYRLRPFDYRAVELVTAFIHSLERTSHRGRNIEA